jgi:tetratricopeptide (TPR) repeat protein
MDAVLRKHCGIVALWLIASLWPTPISAGVYSTAEPKWALSDQFRDFQEKSLIPLRQMGTPQATLPLQKGYDLWATMLLASKDPPPRGQPDIYKPEERLDQAVCLLRIRYPGKQMPEKAILFLNAALDRDKDNFLIKSTLATAYLVTGDYQRAGDWLDEAKPDWAKQFDQLSPKNKAFLKESLQWESRDFAWFAKCEQYQRKLVRIRFKELRKGLLPLAKALERVDQLFDPDPAPTGYQPLRFVGESGKFEPGKLAKAEMEKLPPDATKIVEQLLVWMPDDLRLYWLLGELLNGQQGDVDGAKIVFTELFAKFSQTQESKGLPNIDPKTGQIIDPKMHLPKFLSLYPELGHRYQLLQDYVTPPPDIGDVAPSPRAGDKVKPSESKADGPAVAFSNFSWQALLVIFSGGLLTGFLFCWKVRDNLLRRRTAKP